MEMKHLQKGKLGLCRCRQSTCNIYVSIRCQKLPHSRALSRDHVLNVNLVFLFSREGDVELLGSPSSGRSEATVEEARDEDGAQLL